MSTQQKIKTVADFLTTLKEWKSSNQRVVFTNGCFDLVHIGHVDYLEKARNLGDKLVVGINTDDSVSRFKGVNRPIAQQESRYRVLAAMEFVDAVIPFNEDTPYELIKAILPDVLVKGNDYMAEETDTKSPKYIVGSDIVKTNGGKVETIELVKGFSTSQLIQKIKHLNE